MLTTFGVSKRFEQRNKRIELSVNVADQVERTVGKCRYQGVGHATLSRLTVRFTRVRIFNSTHECWLPRLRVSQLNMSECRSSFTVCTVYFASAFSS